MATIENLQPFKPGSDPRRGVKPKGIEHSSTRLKRLLAITQQLKNPITGEKEGFSVIEQIDLRLIQMARSGDIKAIRELLDRLEGKAQQNVAQTLDVTSKGESIAIAPDPALAAEFAEFLKARTKDNT